MKIRLEIRTTDECYPIIVHSKDIFPINKLMELLDNNMLAIKDIHGATHAIVTSKISRFSIIPLDD